MTFSKRAAGALDIRARPIVVAFEENDAGPDTDRVFVVPGEIVIEPEKQQLFDPGLAVGVVWRVRAPHRVGRQRIGHQGWGMVEAIIGQNSSPVNELRPGVVQRGR